jgi:general secretion pathway protein M
MRQWWMNLAERERQLLLAGSIALVVAILYWGGWHPLQQALQQSRSQVQQLQQQLSWMQQQAPLVSQLKQSAHVNEVSDTDIASALTVSSKTQRIALKRIQPQGANALVELDAMGFDQLTSWLDLLERQYNITPQQIELQTIPGHAGKVQVRRLLLGRNKE